jgi:hypothetical protein
MTEQPQPQQGNSKGTALAITAVVAVVALAIAAVILFPEGPPPPLSNPALATKLGNDGLLTDITCTAKHGTADGIAYNRSCRKTRYELFCGQGGTTRTVLLVELDRTRYRVVDTVTPTNAYTPCTEDDTP